MSTGPQSEVQDIPPGLYQQLIQLNETEMIVPIRMNREDVHKLKAVKVSDQEEAKIRDFQDYLYAREFIPENTFACFFVYLFNYTFTQHKKAAEDEAATEGKNP